MSSAAPSPALGRGVTGFREGDRVVSETAAEICGTCLLCRTGRYNLCTARKGFGYGVDGAMAQFVRVPARCLHHIPDSLPFDIACLAEPHSVAYQVMCVNSRIAPGDFVVVIGPGPIGLLCTRMAALSGANHARRRRPDGGSAAPRCRSSAWRDAHRRHRDPRTSRRSSGISAPIGADLVCDASGASSTLETALRLTRPDGQVSKVGWSPDIVTTDVNPLVMRNIRLQGSFSHNYPVWERVIQLLDRGVTMADTIVGLRAPLAGWREAFDSMHDGRVIKSVLLPRER